MAIQLNIFIFLVTVFFLSCNDSTAQENTTIEAGSFKGNIGVQNYSFRNYFPKDIPGTLDRIKALGITELETTPGRLPAKEYKKLCDERGLKVVSTSSDFKTLQEDPQKAVDLAKDLGADYLMCAWVPHEDDIFTKENADTAIAVFNRAGKLLAENGITFCYHAHGYEFQTHDDNILLDYIIDNTDPAYVSYEMDIFWIAFGGGDPTEYLLKYPNRWKMMHLKDMRSGIAKDLSGHADVEDNVPLGSGQLDIPSILKAAAEVGVVYYFIEDESSKVWEQVEQSVHYLKTVRL